MTIVISLVLVLCLALLTIAALKKIQVSRFGDKLSFLKPQSSRARVNVITEHIFDPEHRFVHFSYLGHDYHMLLSNQGDTLLSTHAALITDDD